MEADLSTGRKKRGRELMGAGVELIYVLLDQGRI